MRFHRPGAAPTGGILIEDGAEVRGGRGDDVPAALPAAVTLHRAVC